MQDKWIIFCVAAAIGLFIFRIAYARGLFNSFSSSRLPEIGGGYVILGFVCYILGQLIIAPCLVAFYLALAMHPIEYSELVKLIEHLDRLDLYTKGWVNFIVIASGAFSLIPAYFTLPRSKRKELWSQTPTPRYKQIGLAIVSWIVISPCVVAINQLISIVVFYFFQHPEIEQLLIVQMRKIISWPILFNSLAITIFTLVPWTEEFLFRGLLQNWLKKLLNNAIFSVVITSILFSCVHFSPSLGWSNIELLLTLFPLSCMLGYLYERQRSLWAPVALHGMYNFMTVILIWLDLE